MDKDPYVNELFAEPKVESASIEQYREALKKFDEATCEAIAVSQATANRFAQPYSGYATYIFTRICGHATALIRAVPKSRWVRSDSENWDFCAIAGHARSIIEGELLFHYVIKKPTSRVEWSAKLYVMHLNDCTRRAQILESSAEQNAAFLKQQDELRSHLAENAWFMKLDEKLRKKLLTRNYLTISTRDEQIEELGWNKKEFYMFWNLLSQYTHVLPFSFYRLEANGRGTGVPNDFDRSYMYVFLDMCANSLGRCTMRLLDEFPDAGWARQGIDSKFAPGPSRNLPRHFKRR